MAGQVTAEEYKKAKDAVNSTYTQDSLNAYKTAYNDAMKSGKSSKEAYASASGLLKKIDSWSSSWSSSWGSSNTNAWGDVYGDVSGVSKNVWAKDYSSYTKQDLGDLSRYGESAKEMERANAWSISKRNDIIAGNLYTDKKYWEQDVRNYLSQQAWFNEADEKDRENTVRAITERLKAIQEEEAKKGDMSGDWSRLWEDLNLQNLGDKVPGAEWKAWYYNTKDGFQKIYGYDEMDDETKKLVDRLDDSKKKYVSNLWASWMQEDLKYYLDTMRAKDQASARQDINKDLYDINRESSLIQAEQTIRNAEESYNNLKQNWQYLGNLWMPWVSSTKIQAIGDAITEAKTTLWEVKRLTQLSLDAQEKQWEGEVLQYNQQIDNLMYDLKWKVWDEITNALSKYTTAELEWKLDTIDGITAFRKELLDDLDNNLSGLTSASLTQMQWINQQYQDVANRMYEYAQNANKVNADMSKVKGYYVDGNGNPILNNQGQPIQVPQDAPMEPVFDKETGKLITFGLDENWQIVASVQQVYPGDATATQSTIVSLLEQGVSVQDILKYVPWVDLKTVQSLAEVVKPLDGWGYQSYSWSGWNYNAVSESQKIGAYNSFVKQFIGADGKVKKGIKGGQCGKFVNDYLQKMGLERLFTDPITEKKKYINSSTPKIWSVVIMDSASQPKYGHVGIVTAINGDKISILQSNKAGEEEVFVSTKNAWDVLGYFDPTKSIDDFNKEVSGAVYQAQGLNKDGYNNTRTGYYDKYLAAKFTTEDWKQIGDKTKFEQEVENYKKAKEGEVADVTKDMLRVLYDLKDMSWVDYNAATLWIPRTDGYKKKRSLQNYLSNVTLNKLIESKKSGATFGALSDAELGILQDAASILDWWLGRGDFNNEVKRMIDNLEQWLRDNGRSDIIAELKSTQNSNGTTKTKVSWGNLW